MMPLSEANNTAAIIVAAGKGQRARSGTAQQVPKQYRSLAGRPVIEHVIEKFVHHSLISTIVIVYADGDDALLTPILTKFTSSKPLVSVKGGADRQASVFAGLNALRSMPISKVLIHDGARPLVSDEIITQVIAAISDDQGAIAAQPISDTIKQSQNGLIASTLERADKYLAQTPQGFPYQQILSAHENAIANSVTDDAALAEQSGLSMRLIESSRDNIKITQAEDFILAEKLMRTVPEIRMGHGIDVHQFESGNSVILAGIPIDYDRKLKGHSDADVVLHALTDAIFGALALGDIGDHFPPSDPQWRGAASEVFLSKAIDSINENNSKINNIDITILCEAPKIGPHRLPMRENIARICKIDLDRVSIKATTTERLGALGRGEGIAAEAIVTLSIY
ncbi:MAG: bifunctional 2-C-methyl-D-erythritol 4-phosphate cytidylyltransferase/2-C-methyl-D-erythritol 2,4-cyclodiphosphate synthase [bacterium]